MTSKKHRKKREIVDVDVAQWWGYIAILGGGYASYKIVQLAHTNYYRPMILFAKDYFDYPIDVVEIGVLNGGNSKRMFDHLDIRKMYLIDPFSKYNDYDGESFIYPFLPKNFDLVLNRLGKYAERAVPLQMASEEASNFVPDGLDMVYIDGNHRYDYVKRDIELYAPKIKSGGLIGGHDIGSGNRYSNDVKRAVYEFADMYGYYVYVQIPDWWIVL